MTWAAFAGIFRSRNMLLLCAMYFTQSYGFYFFITWLPTYLKEHRGLDSVQLGLLAGAPLLLSVLADLLGGISTDYAVRRFGLRWGRASVGIISFTGAAAFMLIGTGLQDAVTAAVFIAIAGAFSNYTLGASWGACVDIGGRQAGVVSACMNTAGQIGGTLSPVIVALVLRRFASWEAPLYLTGCLYAIGALCWMFIDATKPIWERQPEPAAVH
jgi:nitrate/nitrite transporter NarK